MLSPSTNSPNPGLTDYNALHFWHLKITKDFPQPKYYIGQTVLHVINAPLGEILHPVKIVGIIWTGCNWEYELDLPDNHPDFAYYEDEVIWELESKLEAI